MKNRLSYYKTKKVNGHDSLAESKRAAELKLLQRAGNIKNLQEQVSFELQPSFKANNGRTIRKMEYIADFVYFDNVLNKKVVEESKGFKTEVYRIKCKLFQYKYPDLVFIETGLSKKKKKKKRKI